MENELGKRIKISREKMGLTQQQLADACEIGLSYMGYIERGKRIGNVFLLSKIANVLQVSLDYLVYGESTSCVKDAMIEIENQIRNYSIKDVEQIKALIKAYKPQ